MRLEYNIWEDERAAVERRLARKSWVLSPEVADRVMKAAWIGLYGLVAVLIIGRVL